MEIKKSIGKQHYDENAKEYVINMMNGRRKLHKKNGCKDSKCLAEYYDFDTYAQAKESGIEHTECGNCKDLIKDRNEYNAIKQNKKIENDKKIEEKKKKKTKKWIILIALIVIGLIVANKILELFHIYFGIRAFLLGTLFAALATGIMALILFAVKNHVNKKIVILVFVLCLIVSNLITWKSFADYRIKVSYDLGRCDMSDCDNDALYCTNWYNTYRYCDEHKDQIFKKMEYYHGLGYSSSSDKDELTDIEKENAEWAHNVKDYIDKQK